MDPWSAGTEAAAAADDSSAPLTPGSAWRSRDAAGTKPKAGGGTNAASAALGRRAAAAAPSTQPHRPAHARRPAPALLTPSSSATASPARPTASQPSPEPTTAKEVPVQTQGQAWHERSQQVARHRPAGAAAATLPRVMPGPRNQGGGACHLSPCEAELPRQAKHREVQPFRPPRNAGRPSARSTGGSRPRPTSGGPRCDHDSCWPGYRP